MGGFGKRSHRGGGDIKAPRPFPGVLAMPARNDRLVQRVGQALFLAFLVLVVAALFRRESRITDPVYVLVRWPVWLFVCVMIPWMALRVAFWRRGRHRPPSP
jgi:hypothetical protein